MSRPLYEIAQEISRNWANPSPTTKTYIKAMYYLLGMDDYIADLDATTTVRLFLLYSKGWTGPIAERVKKELSAMRMSHAPTNATLFQEKRFAPSDYLIFHCELCEAPVNGSRKYVQAYTHWNACARMCMHCAFFLSRGIDLGDGAVFMATSTGTWVHVHGEAIPPSPNIKIGSNEVHKHSKPYRPRLRLRYRLKRFGTKVMRKCASLVSNWLRRPA